MKRRKYATIALVLLMLLGTGYYLVTRNIGRVSHRYAVAAAFTSMPDNDAKLEQWLRQQKEVAAYPMGVVRSGKTLEIFIALPKGKKVSKAFLRDLKGESERLGYSGQISPFSVYYRPDADRY
jgi:hypothetical protein